MLLRVAIVGALLVLASCNKTEGGDAAGSAVGSAPGSAAKVGPSVGGSFSADLAKELGPAKAGSGSGSDAPKVGSGAAAGDSKASPPKAGSGAAKAGSNAAAVAPAVPVVAPAGDSQVAPPKAGSSTAISPPPEVVKTTSTAIAAPQSHGPVKVPAELAAIKISLLPNWDRDIDRAGTFQYVVRIKGTQSTKTFTFHYGYDDPKAPVGPEQYKKYLQDSKVMVGEIRDRQRGSAWFLEGTDASGLPAFRYVILYGGKHLICYGSLYKDADSNRLGDDRDQTVIQAKQICETLAL